MVKQWPFYAKLTILVILMYLIFYGFFIGQHIFLPLGFAFLFSVLLRPLEKRFLKWRVPKLLSIIITIVIGILCLAGLIMFLSHQISSFVKDVPAVKENLAGLWDKIQQWLLQTFHISQEQQKNLIDKAAKDTMSNIKPVGTIGAITGSLATLILIPVYVFLFLYYRAHLLRFVSEIFDSKHSARVEEVIHEIRYVMQHYITGLLTETTIVAVLNVAGLILIGAPYALLLGIISAILNLIPYIGGLIAVVLTALITFSNTGSVTKLIWSVVIFLIVQLIDNNFLVPRVIASKIKLNALISIVGVLIGGALCGIGGMFLSLPLIAVCKVIFDRVDELKPWGKLLGDDIPSANFRILLAKKRKAKTASK
ncbi:MAG: AI-2E family transporter [Chitinophagaceae bacterium]|nr:AI-2E family transporter [Chitinophagaceae bacterium]